LPPEDASSTQSLSDRSPESTARVLVVDDCDVARQLVRDVVGLAGAVVVGEAQDGLAAVAAVATLMPDVVVMDWQMPRMDGITATAIIRDRWPEIEVIGHSSNSSDQVVAAFRDAGAHAFISKADPAGMMVRLRGFRRVR